MAIVSFYIGIRLKTTFFLDMLLKSIFFLTLIVQESKNTSKIFHTKLCSKGFGSFGHTLLVVIIRLNDHIDLPHMRYCCFRSFHILNCKDNNFFLICQNNHNVFQTLMVSSFEK